jgi:hypothetical protein
MFSSFGCFLIMSMGGGGGGSSFRILDLLHQRFWKPSAGLVSFWMTTRPTFQ